MNSNRGKWRAPPPPPPPQKGGAGGAPRLPPDTKGGHVGLPAAAAVDAVCMTGDETLIHLLLF